MSNQEKHESWNSRTNSDLNGAQSSTNGTELVLFSVVECAEHGYHVIQWTPEIDPE